MKHVDFKKSFALLLAIAMLITQIPYMVFAQTWTGSSDTSWYNSTDTEFEISTAEQLAGLASLSSSSNDFSGKTIRLTQDIVLNNGTFTNDGTWSESGTPRTWTAIRYFGGTFDGGGHTISGLYNVDNRNGLYFGLFGTVYNQAIIKNVGVINSYIYAYSIVGSIAGNSLGTIENCYSNAIIKAETGSAGGICGVQKGYSYARSYIKNCLFTGYCTAGYSIGAITGKIELTNTTSDYTTRTNNYYLAGSAVTNTGIACFGLGTSNNNGTDDTSCTAPKSASELADGSVTYLLNSKTSSNVAWHQNLDNGLTNDSQPVLSSDHGVIYYGYEYCDSTSKIYSNSPLLDVTGEHNFVDDVCTKCGAYMEPSLNGGVYEIYNWSHLYWFAQKVNEGHTDYKAKLMNDIVINNGYTFTFESDTGLVEMSKKGGTTVYFGSGEKGDTSGLNTTFDTTASVKGRFYSSKTSTTETTQPTDLRKWTPIGSGDQQYIGTFDGNGKTVSGLYYTGMDISEVGLFGYIGEGGSVSYVNVSNSLLKSGGKLGGISAVNFGAISNSSNTGTIINSYNGTGGVCGSNEGMITNCFNSGAIISSSSETGGVCGYNAVGTISNCYNTNLVTGSGTTGGVCGYNFNGTVNKSYNTGAVSGSYNVGGVCGYNNVGYMEYCYNTGTVSGERYSVGGVAGANYRQIKNSYNIGAVSGSYNVGGVSGSSPGGLVNCYYLSGCAKDGNNVVQYGKGNGTKGSTTADVTGNTYGKTAEQFKDGSVTYALNGGDTQISPLVWYQTIGVGLPSFSGETVYCGYENCGSTEKAYFNSVPYDTIPEHNFGAWMDNGNGTHSRTCTVCGAVETENHIGEWADNGNGTHSRTCTVCGAVETENHNFSAWADNGNGTHSRTCTTCGYTQTQDHSYDEYYYCADCDSYQPATKTTDKYDIDGNGTKDVVYEIANVGQFYWFARFVNGGNNSANAILTADINLNPGYTFNADSTYSGGTSPRQWTPIGNFSIRYNGEFDGNGKTVSGLYFNDISSDYIGLFGFIGPNKGIKNVNVLNSYIKGKDYVGGVCGYNQGEISNCSYSGAATGVDNVGGLCGYNQGITNNCYSNSVVNGTTNVGGVIGNNSYKLSNCYNTGMVTGDNTVGGICGENTGTISSCYYLTDCANDGNNEAQYGIGIDTAGYSLADVPGSTDGKTAGQFASGEVAAMLQEGCTETTWGQRATDLTPILTSDETLVIRRIIFHYNDTTETKVYRYGEKFTQPNVETNNGTMVLYWLKTDGTVFRATGNFISGLELTAVLSYTKLIQTEESEVSIDRTKIVISSEPVFDGTTASDYKSNFKNDATLIVIEDANGNVLSDTDIVGTGCVIKSLSELDGETVLDSLTVVVMGDVNGDGLINDDDYSLLRTNMINCSFSGAYFIAADICKDGAVDAFDLFLLDLSKNSVNGRIKYKVTSEQTLSDLQAHFGEDCTVFNSNGDKVTDNVELLGNGAKIVYRRNGITVSQIVEIVAA